MEKYYIFLDNVKEAYQLSQKLDELKIEKTLAPTPREADFCCGICIIYEHPEDKEAIIHAAKVIGVEIKGFWQSKDLSNPNRMKFC